MIFQGNTHELHSLQGLSDTQSCATQMLMPTWISTEPNTERSLSLYRFCYRKSNLKFASSVTENRGQGHLRSYVNEPIYLKTRFPLLLYWANCQEHALFLMNFCLIILCWYLSTKGKCSPQCLVPFRLAGKWVCRAVICFGLQTGPSGR